MMAARIVSRVHPRVRGGTAAEAMRKQGELGASPRARGNLARESKILADSGCIPACAGEPSLHSSSSPGSRVHPRVRGGTPIKEVCLAPRQGASPRARGNPTPPPRAPPRCGCIPACAGEPHADPPAPSPRRVHPRVRGGTRARWRRGFTGRGASPRARGNRLRLRLSGRHPGCIPACAGEPRRQPRPAAWRWVHPRVRGGTADAGSRHQASRGASPRARGNRRRRGGPRRRQGCIPACAGEPWWRGGPGGPCRVHPRVRGGTVVPRSGPPAGAGASPRARGNRARGTDVPAVPGCIPACAGEPV